MPFAGYTDFADCVAKNKDKDDPEAYCGAIQSKADDDELASIHKQIGNQEAMIHHREVEHARDPLRQEESLVRADKVRNEPDPEKHRKAEGEMMRDAAHAARRNRHPLFGRWFGRG